MLFFSYVHGKSFMAPLAEMTDELRTVYKLEVKQQQQSTPATPNSSSGPHSSASKNSNNAQPLCQWNEIHGHPGESYHALHMLVTINPVLLCFIVIGLITAFLQTSNNPVVIMVRPGLVMIQEIRVGPKIRIIDMVAIRHSSVNSERRTTLILLCEDGSLKIFMANPETTEFWLSPGLRPVAAIAQIKPPRRRRAAAGMAPGFSGVVGRGAGNVSFPVDFFESCSQISDVEFGGNDVLQVSVACFSWCEYVSFSSFFSKGLQRTPDQAPPADIWSLHCEHESEWFLYGCHKQRPEPGYCGRQSPSRFERHCKSAKHHRSIWEEHLSELEQVS